jgi:hypothetical protein
VVEINPSILTQNDFLTLRKSMSSPGFGPVRVRPYARNFARADITTSQIARLAQR